MEDLSINHFVALALIFGSISLQVFAFFKILTLGSGEISEKVNDNHFLVQYEPPDGPFPLEAGHLINGRLNFDDIAGEIVNLATKGVIKITDTYYEIPLLPDIPDVVLTKLSDDSSLDEAQRKVLNLFFTWNKEVSLFQASKKPGFRNHFLRKFKDLERYLDKKMIEEGLFDQKKYRQLNKSRALVTSSLFLTFFGGFIAGEDVPSLIVIGKSISVFLGIITLLLSFARFWAFYTRKGLDILQKLRGYREFLEATESEKLYIYTNSENVSSLFERHLPFAIALGVGSAWAEKFKNLVDLNLRWYSNTHKARFSALDVTKCLQNIASGASQLCTSKSGISGGSSGGGMGGGGGKSW